MRKMKAIVVRRYGGPEVMNLEEMPVPEPGESELLIRVHGCGVNPADWQIRSGKRSRLEEPFSYVPGFDFAGVVEAIGSNVSGFQVGDAVYGGSRGSYAEYIVCPSNIVALKPNNLNFLQSAALPVVACTAWSALFDVGNLSRGQSILIHAAAGGVGHIAVQLARWKGAYVIGTASGRNEDFLQQLGVNRFINYQTSRFEELVQNIDMVLDTIVRDAQDEIDSCAADTLRRSFSVLRKSGILVSVCAKPSPEVAAEYGVDAQKADNKFSTSRLARIAELVDTGFVKPNIHQVFPLADVRQAHTLSQEGHTRGKIVLQVCTRKLDSNYEFNS